MAKAKIAFFGAGSYVFGPTLIGQSVVENRIDDLHWNLYDVKYEAAELIAAVARRMSESEGVKSEFKAISDPNAALEGADFVICSAAVDMRRRFLVEREIIDTVYPDHLVSEFGGVYGISSTLRQLTMIAGLASKMKIHCPGAWLLDIANPMPRVSKVASDQGIATAGFCSVSLSGIQRVHEIFGGGQAIYPFDEARERFVVNMGGTNHLSWLVDLKDRTAGEDLMPELRRRLHEREGKVASKCEEYALKTGYFLMSGDHHVQDFLPLDGLESSLDHVGHGSAEIRDARHKLLLDVACGDASPSLVLDSPCWERPPDFIDAMVNGKDVSFSSLNLKNEGQIAELPLGEFVETAAEIVGGKLQPRSLSLPASVLRYSALAVEVNQALNEAWREKSRKELRRVVELDPTIDDKTRGWLALEHCLTAGEDLIGEYY